MLTVYVCSLLAVLLIGFEFVLAGSRSAAVSIPVSVRQPLTDGWIDVRPTVEAKIRTEVRRRSAPVAFHGFPDWVRFDAHPNSFENERPVSFWEMHGCSR